MNCPKCDAPGLLVETSADGKTKKVVCQKCGLNELRDAKDRKFLVEVLPSQQRPLLG